MADERISYEMLQDLLRSERRSNKLTPVTLRFWHDVRSFLDEVMAHFREEQGKDPFSRRVMLLTDEVKNARQAADSIWALRERKMALFALSQVREGSPKRPDGLTPDEERIYDHLLEALKAGRAAVLEGVKLPKPTPVPDAAPEAAPARAEPAEAPVPEEAPEPEPVEAAEPEPAPTPDEAAPEAPPTVPADTPEEDMVTIRALGDIPAFVGPDMQTYLLKEGDVATVPQAIADLLQRRKKAAVLGA